MKYVLVIVWPAHEGTPTVYLNMNRAELDQRLDHEDIYIKQHKAHYYIYSYNLFGNPYIVGVDHRLTDEWK